MSRVWRIVGGLLVSGVISILIGILISTISDRLSGEEPTTTMIPASKLVQQRLALGGNYTIGLYARDQGFSGLVELTQDQEQFEGFIGITGDSIRTFSGITLRLGLPEGIELDGAVRWRSINRLTETGMILEEGAMILFEKDCQEQTDMQPLFLGRVRFKATPAFREGEIVVEGHRRYHLGVELCTPGQRKPIATPRNLMVARKLGFWTRLKEMFN